MVKIELKDYSIQEIENKKLYNLLENNSVLSVDTTICEVAGEDKKIAEPIMQIKRSEGENRVEVTTFGYVGRFTFKKQEFDISYRFGENLLDRMIAKVNDFNVKTLEYEAKSGKKKIDDNLALKILYLNFIFKLEKLSILGIPKSYQRIKRHDSKYRGQIDINSFIKKDIPFQGKLSTVSYEQTYIQEIVDVLYSAIVIVEKTMQTLVRERLSGVKSLIKRLANRYFINEQAIQKAISHKAIQNGLYGDFKQVLEIAGHIIRYNRHIEHKASHKFNSLIFDVSLLWENYVYKLLKEAFDDGWYVIHEEPLEVYRDKFFTRYIYPDIVIKNKHSKSLLVFDAKSKSMAFRGKNGFSAGDVDRSDFFQINTYMSYYQNSGFNVIAGGLLYPLEENYEKAKCLSDSWFNNTNTKFAIDGIEVQKDILKAEEDFIARIKNFMKKD